jgi:hypothetical protein
MIKTYTLADKKPDFKDGAIVRVDMDHLGLKDLGVVKGKIVGKASSHVIDFWIVEFEESFGSSYPYRVLSVPHVAILM